MVKASQIEFKNYQTLKKKITRTARHKGQIHDCT